MRNNLYAQGSNMIKKAEHGNDGNAVFGQVNNQSSHVVYMKKDDMLYSGVLPQLSVLYHFFISQLCFK